MFNLTKTTVVPWTESHDDGTVQYQLAPNKSTRALPQKFMPRYEWCFDDNQQVALRYAHGLQIAVEQNLPQQVALYQNQIRQLVHQDRAEGAHALVQRQLRYRRPIHWSTSYDYDAFTVFEQAASPPCEWHYVRIQNFDRLIPPQALVALKFVEQARLAPDGYWVADKFEYSTTRWYVDTPQRSLVQPVADPILSAQFGPFFVALAEWV